MKQCLRQEKGKGRIGLGLIKKIRVILLLCQGKRLMIPVFVLYEGTVSWPYINLINHLCPTLCNKTTRIDSTRNKYEFKNIPLILQVLKTSCNTLLFYQCINITLQFHFQMIVLFVSLHKQDEEGQMKFKKFYDSVSKVLRTTLYYGSNFQQIIRNKTDLDDFLYDEYDLNNNERAAQKFRSVTYIFVEGPLCLPPWAPSACKVLLLIRNSLKENKKLFLSGFGHTAGYYYLTTQFDKQYFIRSIRQSENKTGKQDFFHEEESGDLYNFGKKICNSGVKILKNLGRSYGVRSAQALKKGTILPTKSHYMGFGVKNGHYLISNIRFPITFYEKSKVFCTPILSSKAKVTVLVQTQDKSPLVYSFQNVLSVHVICPETLRILGNWIQKSGNVHEDENLELNTSTIDDLAFQNQTKRMRTPFDSIEKTDFQTVDIKSKFNTIAASRPKTAYTNKTIMTCKSKFLDFEKPSLRCSGPYTTEMQKYLLEQKEKKSKNLGRSRMIFKSEMAKGEIENFVQRTPSRPPSSHNFRQINKAKWLDKKTFYVA